MVEPPSGQEHKWWDQIEFGNKALEQLDMFGSGIIYGMLLFSTSVQKGERDADLTVAHLIVGPHIF